MPRFHRWGFSPTVPPWSPTYPFAGEPTLRKVLIYEAPFILLCVSCAIAEVMVPMAVNAWIVKTEALGQLVAALPVQVILIAACLTWAYSRSVVIVRVRDLRRWQRKRDAFYAPYRYGALTPGTGRGEVMGRQRAVAYAFANITPQEARAVEFASDTERPSIGALNMLTALNRPQP